jgi:hypothetical protein
MLPSNSYSNEKGGTDARVLAQVLKRYMLTLFPDSADEPGKRVLIKIDGGPGHLDVVSLAELQTLSYYAFPGVQNTPQIAQETDQNDGQFKSLLRKHIQLLLNEQYAQYKYCQQENLPCEPPNLNWSHYGILLGGRPTDEENGIKEIPPIFALSFSKEKNIRSWEICGACPLTRA